MVDDACHFTLMGKRMVFLLGLMMAGGPAHAAPRFIFSTFKSDAVADEKLFIYESTDGLNFKLLSDTGYSGPTPGTLRDPSSIKFADGKYYVAHTNPQGAGCCGNEDHFSIATSSDLIHWTQLTTVKGAIPNLAHVWAPEWFVEGNTVNIIVHMDTGAGDFQQYLFTALDASLTTWRGPVLMGIARNHIDTFVVKVGSTYHAFTKSESTRYLEHATASTLTGPWTLVGTGDWAGWGAGMEGPTIVKLDSGMWRMFMDPQQSTFFYSDSADLLTWSQARPLPGVAAVVRHGTVIRDESVGQSSGASGGAGGTTGLGGNSGPGGFGGAAAGGIGGRGFGDFAGASGMDHDGGSGSADAGSGMSSTGGGGGSGGLPGATGGSNVSGGSPGSGGSPSSPGTGGAGHTGSVGATETAGCGCSLGDQSAGQRGAALIVLLAACRLLARRHRGNPA